MKLTITIEGPMVDGELIGGFIKEAAPGCEFTPASAGVIIGTAPNGASVRIKLDADTLEIIRAMDASE